MGFLRRLAIAFFGLTAIFGASLALAPQAGAAADLFKICSKGGGSSAACSSETENISGTGGVVLKAANLVAIVAGIAAIIMIMLGGFNYITAGGDSNKISTAKNMVIYALVGLVVIALARTIVGFVIGRVA